MTKSFSHTQQSTEIARANYVAHLAYGHTPDMAFCMTAADTGCSLDALEWLLSFSPYTTTERPAPEVGIAATPQAIMGTA